jgi:cystathionine gamma-lyase
VLARFLAGHPQVGAVLYPGLPSHPQHALACRQATGFGGMISFVPGDGTLESRPPRVRSLQALHARARVLGGVESLVCHPASMTHASVPRETRLAMGFADGLLRLSVGIEDVADLQGDLEQALQVSERLQLAARKNTSSGKNFN